MKFTLCKINDMKLVGGVWFGLVFPNIKESGHVSYRKLADFLQMLDMFIYLYLILIIITTIIIEILDTREVFFAI